MIINELNNLGLLLMDNSLMYKIYSNEYLYKYWITGQIHNGIKKNTKNIKISLPEQ